MSLKTDKIQLEILLKGDNVRKELVELEAESKKLARELKKLPKDTEAFAAKFAELKKAEARMEELRNQIGLTGLTMRELRNRSKELMIALNNIDPRTPQYKLYRAELDKVNARMRELRTGSEKTGMSFGKMADNFNKYMGMFAAISAGLLGVVLSMRKMVDAFDEYEQKVANLSAITGLAGDDLQWLSDKAKELSTSTTDSGVRITKSADDIVDAFTKVGSKRPELLANKEAMAEVTEQALILAEAGQMELEVVIDAVTASMNQFNLGADQSERIINTLAAGSLEGSAEVDSLAGSLKNVGTVANNSNLTLEQTVAALEVLASKQLLGEEAGTKFRGALLKMKEAGVGYQSGVFNMRDALIETNARLAGMGSQMEKDAAMQKIFGTENVTVGTILLGNIDAYDKLTTAVTGTDTAVQQATTNTSTHKAELEQAKNRAHLMAVELGEKLAPIMTFSTNTATMFLKALMKMPEIVQKNKVLFIALGTALLAYNAAKLKGIAIKIRDLALMKSGFTLRAKEYVQYQQLLYQEKLATIQKNNLGKSVGALKGGFQKLWAAISMNPLGAVIIAVGAVIAAYALLKDSLNSITVSQKKFNEANQKAAEYAGEERKELGMLVFELKRSTKGSVERKEAIEKLNTTYGKYLPNLLSENASYKDIVKALVEINKQIEIKAKLQAYEELLSEAYKAQKVAKDELVKTDDRLLKGQFQKVYDDATQTINDFNAEIQVLRVQQSALAKETEEQVGEYDKLIAKITELESKYKNELAAGKTIDAKKTKEQLDQLIKQRNELDGVITANDDLGDSTKEVKTEYEKLNEEISKYEKLLQEQIYNKDARAAATAEKLQDLKDEKKLYEDLTKSILDAAAVKKLLDEYQIGDPEKLNSLSPDAVGRDNKPDIIGSDVLAQHSSETDQLTDKEKAGQDKKAELQMQYQMMLAENLINIANQAQDVIEAYAERRINRQYNKEVEALKAKFAAGKMTEDQYNAAVVAAEEKKAAAIAKVKRKVAVFEKGVAITQIGIDTFKKVAEIKAMAALLTANPATVAYAPVALAQIPLVIANSAVQAALIAAKPINEYAEGRYPVTGRSGRKYNADFVGRPRTGIYSKPSLGIFSEQRPELIVDYPTLRTLQMRSPEVINEIYRAAGKIPEFAEGKYPDKIAGSSSSAGSDQVVSMKLDIVIQLLTSINANGQNTQTYKDLFERLEEEGKRKDFINNKFTA